LRRGFEVAGPITGDAEEETRSLGAVDVEARTQQLGRTLFERTRRYRPSPVEAAGDRAMALLSDDPRFRARLLRFIDALAGLDGDRSGRRVRRLLQEYLDADFRRLPMWLRLLLPVLRSDLWPAPVVAWTARGAARTVASRFIASGGAYGALRALGYLRAHGRYPSFDVLGEYVASEREADAYRDEYLELLRVLARAPAAGQRTPGGDYQLQVSIKLSSLTADFNPVDPDGTLARVRPRLGAIVESAQRRGIGVTLDMERYETRGLVLWIFTEVFRPGGRFGDWDGIGVVLQAYLRDAERQADELLHFAGERGVPFGVRLVKGAYWDYETVVARAQGWPSPVWEEKAETDLTFERLTARLLDAHPAVRLAVASHNLRSHAHAEALREARDLPAGTVEHQTLFRTAEGITRALASMGWPVRDYVPLGDLLPGMAYLVRRILENSSQVGFLLQSRSGETVEQLLAPPIIGGRAPTDARAEPGVARDITAPIHQFRNHPPKRLFLPNERQQFADALTSVRAKLGREYPLRLGGKDVRTRSVVEVPDPSRPDGPPIGLVHDAGEEQIARALALADAAAREWASRPVSERAAILRSAADRLGERRDETAAWIVFEGAKSWVEALADVDEAIDYLRYYALSAEVLAPDWAECRPRGLVAVIPPWNFPIAIPCGMTSAALVAGNAVILKPAEQTPLIARRLVGLLHEAGVPEDALIWLPGPGETVGAALVASPLVDMVAFTGSRAVGTRIFQQGAAVEPVRGGLRATVAEMGGKNAVLVFPDADLDEAVVGILRSAFGHANQKCSAASRVLIHQDVYPRLRGRLIEGARSLPTGPADDPGTLITPLIDEEARERVLRAGETARDEGRVLLDELRRPHGDGGTSLPTVLGPELVEIPAARSGTARTAQEEIFGPVLVLTPFESEQEAVRLANGTRYALTGGVFSRSPGTVSRMARALDVGNLYVNRPITGARVGVEPFGGHRMSGTGPKAGGQEYLWAFVTGMDGYRRGEPLPQGSAQLAADALQPWIVAAPRQRAAIIRDALALLRGSWRPRWEAVGGSASATSLSIVDALLVQIHEVAAPEPTVPLPGQQTETRWDTPRGCGLVLVDVGAASESLTALAVAPLLAGNGVAVCPDRSLRPRAELLVAALNAAGVPETVVRLAPEDLDLTSAIGLPSVTFAAVDVNLEQARIVYRLLGEASAAPDATELKALISLVDGPRPGGRGFLRRFALPKTVAVQTLHLGADLELLTSAGE
jgi:RHH-type proline utilization regulon transcriptional repressor/proline dehydrogenase/delta 1-pyrroline-5-carboxylate dehydrogenase